MDSGAAGQSCFCAMQSGKQTDPVCNEKGEWNKYASLATVRAQRARGHFGWVPGLSEAQLYLLLSWLLNMGISLPWTVLLNG